uniref:Uncharacterized protein n=3 Tax=Meloidogyne TaxID=189290 RepID=A0A6V7XJU3_MELEN|nr:unnamed protein product [Meloidogyne enterolobii]CAD2209008.1 unnamed protein product [Meloidogyne enterolobii]
MTVFICLAFLISVIGVVIGEGQINSEITTVENVAKECVTVILAKPSFLRYSIGIGVGFCTISGGLFLLSTIYMFINWLMNDLNKIEKKLKEKNNTQND